VDADRRIVELVGRVAKQAEELADRDEQIARLTKSLADQDTEVDRRIAELEGRVAKQAEELADRDEQIARLTKNLADRSAEVEELAKKQAELEKKVAALPTTKEKAGRNSSNSNRPPSSDSPAERSRRAKKKPKSNRKRGGQPKHRGTCRELLPTEQVDDIIDSFPSHCEECAQALPETPDPDATRFQVTELPAFEPHTTEYREHSVGCPCCRHVTRARRDPRAPASPFGPRLMSAVALLTGVYHLSRRKAACLLSDMAGVKISLGAVSAVEARVSEAVAKPVQEAVDRVIKADVKHTDGTSWYQAGIALSLWVIATACATVFKVLANGKKATLSALLFGNKQRGVLVGDRATALTFWAMERRQVCWAHLLRKFVSFSECAGAAGRFGRELLDFTGIIFDYWHRYRDGTIGREALRTCMRPVREQVEALLERAVKSGNRAVAGSCADMLAHRAALWRFVDERDVEPTNNHAERELRAFVLWRKRSYGSQSERGNRFAERLMTVAHTARKQNKNVLEFLTECCVAKVDGGEPPSLFEGTAA
jgi:transposase